MKTIICNRFSLDMIPSDCNVDIKKLNLFEFLNFLKNEKYSTCIGDKKISKEFKLPYNKGEIRLDENTQLIVIKSSSLGYGESYRFYCIENKGVLNG